jgi:phage gp46-like protein
MFKIGVNTALMLMEDIMSFWADFCQEGILGSREWFQKTVKSGILR